jgi:hypothetical protein
MNVSRKNITATVLVLGIVVPYIGYLIAGEMPFIEDPRGMSATGLILGLAAALVVGRAAFDREPGHRAGLVAGVVALGLGIASLLVDTSELLLALFILSIVVTWILGELASMRRPVSARRPMVNSGR